MVCLVGIFLYRKSALRASGHGDQSKKTAPQNDRNHYEPDASTVGDHTGSVSQMVASSAPDCAHALQLRPSSPAAASPPSSPQYLPDFKDQVRENHSTPGSSNLGKQEIIPVARVLSPESVLASSPGMTESRKRIMLEP